MYYIIINSAKYYIYISIAFFGQFNSGQTTNHQKGLTEPSQTNRKPTHEKSKTNKLHQYTL